MWFNKAWNLLARVREFKSSQTEKVNSEDSFCASNGPEKYSTKSSILFQAE